MNKEPQKTKVLVKRINGYLHRIVQVIDGTGKVVHSIATPFQVELKPRDIFQIIVGSYLLAVPVAFTEEVWVLSEQLPLKNIVYVAFLSLFFKVLSISLCSFNDLFSTPGFLKA